MLPPSVVMLVGSVNVEHPVQPSKARLPMLYSDVGKVKEVIFKRAQVVIPQVLQRVSERINAQYRTENAL